MKKVLIISYYFPPCNLTSAQRIGSWEKYLPRNRFYPIVVTRNWTGKELSETQRLESSGKKERYVKKENSEIYYMPYKASLRDYFFRKREGNVFYKLCSKILTTLTVFFRHFSLQIIPYSNIYFKAKEILINNPDIKLVIISVDPFEQFSFGYHIKKEFPQIKWVADYRDDWTTSEIDFHLFRPIQSFFEKKWVKTASAIISVSPYYTQKISKFINVKGFTIFNGFDFESTKTQLFDNNDSFIITYNGTLYESQPIDIFLNGFKRFLNCNINKRIHIHFPGLAILNQQKSRVEKLLSGFENYYTITDRLPKNDVIELQLKSDILLMVAHQNVKGIPSSKIFEYIGLQKEFIVCPSDNDVLDYIAYECGLGKVLNNEEEVFHYLQLKISQKDSKNLTNLDTNKVNKFSAINQVNNLSKLLTEL